MIKCLFHLAGYRRMIPSHIAQVVFGFQKLARDGILELSFADSAETFLPPCSWLAEVNGVRVCCDTADANLFGAADIDRLLETKLDFIFKRSFDPAIAQNVKHKDRFLPLGLFYRFFPPHRFSIAAVAQNQENRYTRKAAEMLRTVKGLNAADSLFCCTRDVDRYWTIGSVPNPDIDILFSTRLWDDCKMNPDGGYQRLPLGHGACFTDAPDWKERTDERIAFLLEFRSRFKGRKVVCGVSDSPLARELCPDLILPHRVTDRTNYRKTVRRSKVCVTTTGLWGSTGGKFTEFVSAGKAIVSNPLRHAVPGEFTEGKNYLAFADKEELFERCERLLDRPEEARLMGLRNAWYYRHYVRPDMMVLNMIRTVLEVRSPG